MHWRTGFKRTAYALAALYGLAALVGFWVTLHDAFLDEAHSPFGPKLHTYVYTWDNGGKGEVLAPNQKLADEIGYAPYAANPGPEETVQISSKWNHRYSLQTAFGNLGLAIAGWGLGFVALFIIYRGLRWIARGFLDGEKAA